MRFVFSKYFFFWVALGVVPLSLSWNLPVLRWIVLLYNAALFLLALVDWRISQLPSDLRIEREFGNRFAIGDANEVRLKITNESGRDFDLQLKDEFPTQLELVGRREGFLKSESNTTSTLIYELKPAKRGKYEFGKIAVRNLSKLGLVWCQTEAGEKQTIKVYPNMRRAREVELAALGAQSLIAAQRRSVRRGEGRDFESMREYVTGDELRHVSWTATARRGKLVTRQYQIERDQTILVAIDAGRLMTGRIEDESKFDSAIQATLALMSAGMRGGDNVGIAVFGRRIKKFLPPKRGVEYMDAALELLHDVEPEMVEPSYARALEFVHGNLKKRALVVILTDIIDEEGSKELLNSLKILRPRHLPIVVTIGDRDLRQTVRTAPETTRELFQQSVAEEVLQNRETALRKIETMGGMALDVTTRTLAPQLLQTYLRVKERGML